jgi:Type II secretory pathway, component PulF
MALFGNEEKDVSWQYEGRTKTGTVVSGTVEAPTAIIARVKLRKKDITPISIKSRTVFSGFTSILGNLRSKSSNTHEKRVRKFTSLARSREIHSLVQGQDKAAKK